MNKLAVLALLAPTLLTGCSAHQLWFGETKPHLTFTEFKKSVPGGESSKIFVWSPKNTAALINNFGKGCVQGAEVFHSQSGDASVSDALVKMLSGLNLSTGSTGKEKALALNIANDIVLLRNNSERNTYLSIGLFGLCQLQVNGAIDGTQLAELITALFASSVILDGPEASRAEAIDPVQLERSK